MSAEYSPVTPPCMMFVEEDCNQALCPNYSKCAVALMKSASTMRISEQQFVDNLRSKPTGILNERNRTRQNINHLLLPICRRFQQTGGFSLNGDREENPY